MRGAFRTPRRCPYDNQAKLDKEVGFFRLAKNLSKAVCNAAVSKVVNIEIFFGGKLLTRRVLRIAVVLLPPYTTLLPACSVTAFQTILIFASEIVILLQDYCSCATTAVYHTPPPRMQTGSSPFREYSSSSSSRKVPIKFTLCSLEVPNTHAST